MIETKRLYIVDAAEKDIETIIKLENDKDNWGFIWSGTYEEHEAEIEDKNHVLFVFKRKEDNLIVGYALIKLDFNCQVFELQRIAISFKRIGYGKEVMTALLKYAFEDKNLNCFCLDVYPYNEIGIKFYEGLGMHSEEEFIQKYRAGMDYLDEIRYLMFKDEYFQKYKKEGDA